MKQYVVTPDKHFPYHNKSSISVLCKTIEKIKPYGYIDLGDTGDWESISHHKFKKIGGTPRLEYYLPSFITEIEEVNKGMDIIDKSLDKAKVEKRYFIQGNHEVWMDMFVEQYPYLPQYNTKDALKLEQRGYKYYDQGDFLTIGNLGYYHGDQYGGMHHAANHCNQFKCNVMYGHHHDVQVYTAKKKLNGPITAYSIGCLKNMTHEDNKFAKGRPLNWKQAFAIVTYTGKDHFVEVVEINNGKAIINGALIEG